MKKLVNYSLRKFGLELKRVNQEPFDIELYRRLFSKESIESKRFYNVGAGGFYHPFWTNIDYITDWYKKYKSYNKNGIHYDLFSLSEIPIENSVAEIVYSSHTIEHIKDEHAQYFYNEAFRILKKGGIIRLTCPDIDLHYKAYKNYDFDFFYWRDWYSKEKDYKRIRLIQPLNTASIEQLFLHRFATAATILHADGIEKRISDDELRGILKEMNYEEALNYICDRCPIEIQKRYPGNHTNWWNREKLIKMLRNSGFRDIFSSAFGQSQSPVLRNISLFDSTHPKISLYVEAVK
jgi:predicted SAM-dependent methyltransferase